MQKYIQRKKEKEKKKQKFIWMQVVSSVNLSDDARMMSWGDEVMMIQYCPISSKFESPIEEGKGGFDFFSSFFILNIPTTQKAF